MKIILHLCCAAFVLGFMGCTETITKEEFAPRMYDAKPASILVLPPINKSTAADAKEYYSTTVAEPLTNAGYYVFPMEVVYDILQQEGLFDTETMENVPPQKFKEYFGADAVLRVTILDWNTSYLLTSGSVSVKMECELTSTATGDVLWFYDNAITLDTSGDSGGASGWAGLLAKVVSTAIKTAAQDYVPIARDVSKQVFRAMPYGKYHKQYGQDRRMKVEKKKQANKKTAGQESPPATQSK